MPVPAGGGHLHNLHLFDRGAGCAHGLSTYTFTACLRPNDMTANQEIRTLILDDDPAMCVRLEFTASRRGFAIETHRQGAEALEAHVRLPFDLMIVDWMMPGMDGLEFCRRIRELPDGHLPVVLLVTSCDQQKDLPTVLSAGVDDYLAKPFTESALRTRLAIAQRNVAEVRQREQIRIEMDSLNSRLLQAAREAGMAEVATSVLHNVGNVLNSVNVSARVAAGQIRQSRLFYLHDAVAMMRRHSDDLPAFFTQDEKGKYLPDFFGELAEQLRGEQESSLAEIDSLVANIEHIKDIIRMQQSYTGVDGVRESCQLSDVLENALRFAGASFDKYGIKVVREYHDVPQVKVEKAKLIHILVNLISNAKDALIMNEVSNKVLTLSVGTDGNGLARIEVADNGTGINQEQLTKIFSHGFTTKRHGHGFGLHSAANAATEMGGSLSVFSSGENQGATFTVELPLERETVSV